MLVYLQYPWGKNNEKHFTLDKNFSNFRDHKLSADPSEFKLLVNKIRIIENMLGNSQKNIGNSEKKFLFKLVGIWLQKNQKRKLIKY